MTTEQTTCANKDHGKVVCQIPLTLVKDDATGGNMGHPSHQC